MNRVGFSKLHDEVIKSAESVGLKADNIFKIIYIDSEDDHENRFLLCASDFSEDLFSIGQDRYHQHVTASWRDWVKFARMILRVDCLRQQMEVD